MYYYLGRERDVIGLDSKWIRWGRHPFTLTSHFINNPATGLMILLVYAPHSHNKWAITVVFGSGPQLVSGVGLGLRTSGELRLESIHT